MSLFLLPVRHVSEILLNGLTETASEITHIPEQFFTVTIKELPDENFGIVGKSIDEIKRKYNR